MEKHLGGAELKGGSLPADGVVGFYFSAHWCPPCRGFTPKLAETYKALKGSDKAFEIVFISSDKSEEEFNSYYAEHPWLALPFENRDLKNSLSKKFKVNGIPALVLMDAKTGDIITKEGRSAISKDPEGLKYPWIPPTTLEVLGNDFISSAGSTGVSVKGKYVGIYFSAHWCGPCRNFTPKLVETYNKIRESRQDFEVVFCSADKDETQFKEYFGTMPWLAIPFSDKERKGALNEHFGVEGIPTLVILDPSGKVITKSGDDSVRADPTGTEFPWHPKPVSELDEAAGKLNESTALVVFCESATVQEKEAIDKALLAVATQWRAEHPGEEEELIFCSAKKSGSVTGRVRELCKLDKEEASPRMVLLDIPDLGGYYVGQALAGKAVDEAGIKAFLAAYKEKTLTRMQLE